MKDVSQDPSTLENQESQLDTELHELFLEEIADLLDAENQWSKVLPMLVEAAHAGDLAKAFQVHLEATERRIARLKDVFTSVGEIPRKHTCEAMRGLLHGSSELTAELAGTRACDAGLIAAAQKVGHYEIASYGTVLAWARRMGHSDAVPRLAEILTELKATDARLTQIAESIAT